MLERLCVCTSQRRARAVYPTNESLNTEIVGEMIPCGGGHQHNCLLTPSSGRRFEVQRYDRGASTKNSSTEKGKIDNANDTGTNPIVSRLRFHSMRLRGGKKSTA